MSRKTRAEVKAHLLKITSHQYMMTKAQSAFKERLVNLAKKPDKVLPYLELQKAMDKFGADMATLAAILAGTMFETVIELISENNKEVIDLVFQTLEAYEK